MQNIEFKAELRDREAARAQCRHLGGTRLGVLHQTDTYYRLADGRLKQRVAPGEPTEWIYYHRPDRVTPRMSNYSILNERQARVRWGTGNLRPWRTVVKTRELWLIDEVRVHIDDVDDLGSFIEFEAPVTKTLDVKACHRCIAELKKAFGPVMGEHIAVSYCDLLGASEDATSA